MMKRFFPAVLVLALTACASATYNENSQFSSVPAGSTLSLNRAIEIGSDQVSVYMQDGKFMDYAAMNHYQPHCKFEVYTIADHPRQVRPDSFRISRVVDNTELAALRPVALASLGAAMTDDGYQIVTYTTSMYLESEKQPDVYRMSCMHWDDISEHRYLSINEMRKAMGDIFSLQTRVPEKRS